MRHLRRFVARQSLLILGRRARDYEILNGLAAV
jgi:hypothetical protein